MCKYKLYYFNWRARAEIARMLFFLADVEYEDIRISAEDWPKYKEKMPYLQIPVLEVDGQRLCQSIAIEGYLARKYGFAGKSEWEQAKVEMIVLCMADVLKDMVDISYCKDDKTKENMINTFLQETFVRRMEKLEAMLEENGQGHGYFIGNELTWADLAVYHQPTGLQFCISQDVDWSRWPKLKALRTRVECHPKLRQWIKQRPDTVV